MRKAKNLQRQEWEAIGIERAKESRGALGLGVGPISDIFQIIEQQGILLIRYPAPTGELHAFYAEIDGFPVIYINSTEVLGRQIFSAAHELCHFLYDRDSLKTFLCNPGGQNDKEDKSEIIADTFAGEFLIPKSGVQSVFHKYFNNTQMINEVHVIKMQHYFKVSYGAMVYNMFKSGVISGATYGKLKKLGSIENSDELRRLIKHSGYNTNLIDPTPPQYPHAFFEKIVKNHEQGLISYGKLESLLNLWDRTPEEFGLEKYEV